MPRLPHPLRRIVAELHRHLDVFEGGQRVEQIVHLKDEADARAAPRRGRAAARRDRSRPNTSIRPSCTERKAPIKVNRVVLPAPDGPVITTS